MARGGPSLEEMEKLNLDQFLDKDVDLSQFFSKQELQVMGSHQQTRLKNIAQNYEIMLYMGLPAIKPDFMKGRTHRAKEAKIREQAGYRSTVTVKERKSYSDSDSDETWTPDMERKKRAKEKKMYPAFMTAKKRKCKNDGIKEKRDMYQKESKDHTPEKKVYDLRQRKAVNFMHLEAPDDDHFLYCEECNKEYDMDCPVHGALEYIRDAEVSSEYDPDRALHTLPPGLVVKPSGIVGAGLGVFTEEEIQPRVMFGPYGGVKIYDEMKAHDSGYCWQIYADGKPSHFVDAKDKVTANWMRYVNCAPSESEQNLVAFQFKGGIYYRSYKTISPGTELLCWYGNEYGRELGLVRDKNLLIRPKLVNGTDCYPCVFCKIAFTTATYNVRHLVRMHGKDKLSQTDIQVLDKWLRKNDMEEYTKRRKHKYRRIDATKNNSYINQHREKLGQSIESTYTDTELQSTGESLYKNDILYDTEYNGETNVGEKCFKCDVYGYECNQGSDLKTHMRIHTREKCFKCDVCDYANNFSSGLKTHMRIHTGEKCFKCDVCNYACNVSSTLKAHMRIHTGEKCFKCDVCDYACNVSSDLKRHMRIHTGEKCFKCDVCDYACNYSSALKRHKRIHTGEKCFKCDVCDYACNYSSALKTHKRIHTGEKCFKCDVCDYACKVSSTLKAHMRIHTGEKCFKCDVCDYASNFSSALKTHMRIHTGEKCFKCDVCDYACKVSSTLKAHMRIHTGEKCFKCDVCDYACNYSSDLKRHMRIHTGEKCFKCDVCDYACNISSNLKKHMRIHTGEKCFKCDVCDYACNVNCNLKAHMRKHKGWKSSCS
ncbi:zinc finger protein 85-like isoform X2 [Mercenaria mercenaria]|nr:zinc finger protein 85-like isoform X2 [Mercenaria mercenaria]XP_045178774.2 zinc finger protein 85-like isoform X2 [Mercenaria mercenaria]